MSSLQVLDVLGKSKNFSATRPQSTVFQCKRLTHMAKRRIQRPLAPFGCTQYLIATTKEPVACVAKPTTVNNSASCADGAVPE